MTTDDSSMSHDFDEIAEDASMFDNDSHLAHVDDDASYVCDNCGEEIVIPVDLGGGQDQTYVEDCPVCCSPNVIHVHVEDDRIDIHSEPE